MLQSKDFSVSGASVSGNLYTFILRVAELSTDVVKNTSKLQVQAILTQSITGTGFSSWGTGVSCALNGEQIFSDYAQRRISGTKEHVFYTWEGGVRHDAVGSLPLRIWGGVGQPASASYTPPGMEVEGEMSLSVIARASSINASSGNIGEAVMLAISKKNDRFTHTIAYRFCEEKGYIDADGNAVQDATQLSAASCAFRLPESFYEEIPHDPSGQCELICTTYDGDVQIGQPQSCSFTAVAEKSRCKPLLHGQVKDANAATVALTGDENVLIRYASTAQCTAQAQAQNGAQLESVQINGAAGDSLAFANTESGTFLFAATDSRGYETAVTVEKNLIPYVKLTCNPQPGRTDPATGLARVVLTGNCYSGDFGASHNSLCVRYALPGGQVTELSLQPAEDHSYAVTLEIPGLDYTQSYELLLQVEDRIAVVDTQVHIGQAEPVFDWGRDYFRFHVPVIAPVVNDRGLCIDVDAARLPGVYRLTGQPVGEGLLLVFAGGDMLTQLAVGTDGRKMRLITQETAPDWVDW